eukprot:CAMPEP_0184505134 /NCGR_PEP_ID=MMETSP0113_2-20130426/52827_1 /TAXON_ID=91329 /ORGANISM="Norrisiella sphaerica, Strain BC52" /LENGTH=130 /DNA_ID=CAMNT_0026894807 /DNA_START=1574 /DNA_END=1963 /DNA_ORIENTATION=+
MANVGTTPSACGAPDIGTSFGGDAGIADLGRVPAESVLSSKYVLTSISTSGSVSAFLFCPGIGKDVFSGGIRGPRKTGFTTDSTKSESEASFELQGDAKAAECSTLELRNSDLGQRRHERQDHTWSTSEW